MYLSLTRLVQSGMQHQYNRAGVPTKNRVALRECFAGVRTQSKRNIEHNTYVFQNAGSARDEALGVRIGASTNRELQRSI